MVKQAKHGGGKNMQGKHGKQGKLGKRGKIIPPTRQALRAFKAPSLIANKQARQKQSQKRKDLIKLVRKKERNQRQKRVEKGQEQKQVPITVEDKRQFDQNFVLQQDQQVLEEEQQDQFSKLLNGEIKPKLILTTSYKPSNKLYDFVRQFRQLIPDTHYYPRGSFSMPDILAQAKGKDFTHLIVARQHKAKLHQLLITLLPNGPTFAFRTTSLVLNKDIDHHGCWTDHNPQLILRHFNSKVGRRTGRLFASLFEPKPDFRGRRVVTFHNQRDFIFLRHHRYMFDEQGRSVGLQQIGPRITLRLKQVRDQATQEREWVAEDKLYVRRQAVYL